MSVSRFFLRRLRPSALVLIVAIASEVFIQPTIAANDPAHPNIVVILADDKHYSFGETAQEGRKNRDIPAKNSESEITGNSM